MADESKSTDLAADLLLFAATPVKAKEKKKSKGISKKNLFVRNLAITTTHQTLEDLFSEIGPTKRCFVVTDTENHNICAGYGFVHFALESDAQKALQTLQGKPLEGKNIIVERAIPRETRDYIPKGQRVEEEEDEDSDEDMAPIEALPSRKKQRTQLKIADPARVVTLSADKVTTIDQKELRKFVKGFKMHLNMSKIENVNGTTYITLGNEKEARALVNLLSGKSLKKIKLDGEILGDGKRSRLIVRNLSFRCPQKHLQNVFSQHGTVVQISIPIKKGTEKRSGFAFVQFLKHSEAEKAITALNGTEIDHRPIAVDWALPKDKYVKHVIQSQHEAIQDEDSDHEESSDGESEQESDKEENKESGEESSEESSSSEEEEEEEKEKEIGSFDVHHGQTIFIRNLSFESMEPAIEDLFYQWGEVEYANIVRDFETKRSRGTAFVKFKDAACAEKCLKDSYPKIKPEDREGESVTDLHGRNLILSIAVDRKKARILAEEKEKKPKKKEDKRNLYLAYEGVITEQDEAAKEISPSDLAKRQRAMVEKKGKLQNPNFFVSNTRLSVRNIPKEWSEKELRTLFKKHAPPGAALKQVKIVRETERVDSSTGKARSRGFGFVEFFEHNDALLSLRALNNNPKIWTKQARPIIEFAVENAKALQKLHATMSRGKVNVKDSRAVIAGKKRQREADKKAKVEEEKEEPLKKKKKTETEEKKSNNTKTAPKKEQEKPTTKKRKEPQYPVVANRAKSATNTAIASKSKVRPDISKGRPESSKGRPQQQKPPKQAATPQFPRETIGRTVEVGKGGKKGGKKKKDSFDSIVDSYKRKFQKVAEDSSRNKKWFE